MKKKLTAIILASVMTMGMLPVMAMGAESGTCGDNVTWTLEYSTLTISGTGDMADYSSSRDVPWNSLRSSVHTGVINNGVTSMGMWAFSWCDRMTSITIPMSVTNIGDYAFYSCRGLTSIDIPTSVTRIGDYAFEYCGGLTSITIPNGVTSIGRAVFRDCGIKSINIPNSVTSIGIEAFYSCGLTSIDIPAGVTSIGGYAFYNCDGLTSITIPNGVTSISMATFQYCDGLTSITIPASVTSIGKAAFYECGNLTSIDIPASVTRIGDSAFYGCGSLKDVYYSGTQAQWDEINISEYGNEALLNATIHYKDAAPEETSTTYTDSVTGISAKAAKGVLAEGAKLVAEKISPAVAGITGLSPDAELYDIHFEKDGSPVQPDGEVEVSIPVPAGMNGENCKVYFIDEAGNKTDMNAVYKNGYMVFKTSHFSYYVVEKKKVPAGDYKVGDVNDDGAVNAKDKAVLNRYLAGWDGYKEKILNWEAADIDGKDGVNAKDKAILNRYLAGWNGYDEYFN